MHQKGIKILKIVLPLAIGVFIIWYSINSSTPDERQLLWKTILHADMKWIILSVILGILSHLSRAYRWQYLITPLGYTTKFSTRFMAVMIGYLANLGIPRSGEVLRGATLSGYEQVPFEKNLGTIVSERIIDFILLLIITGITLLLQYDFLATFLVEKNINPILPLLILFLGILLGIFFLRSIKTSQHKILVKIRTFGLGLLEGIKSIFTMQHKWSFIIHTLFIWSSYIAMIYVSKFAIPGCSDLSFEGVLVAFVVGSFAMTMTNGGIGIYPISIGAILVLYSIDKQSGEALGWVIWGSQTLLVLILGSLSFILLPILNRAK